MPNTDTSYFDSISQNISLTTGKQIEGIQTAGEEAAKISLNENLNTETAVIAQGLNAVDASIQSFGALANLANNAVEATILPALAALGMKGIACLPITKQMDPVMGIDVHLVMVPPSPVPVPMPHPYIGMLFRAKDFVAAAVASFIPPPPAPPPAPASGVATDEEQTAANVNKAVTIGHTVATMAIGMMGATVKIGGFIPRAVAGTPTKSVPHFPMGASFFPGAVAAIEKNKGHAFLGSMLALADNDPIAGGGVHLHNSCCDVGIPSPHTFRKSKNTDDSTKTKLQLFLPTGMVTPIPSGKSILTNPMPAPFNPMAIVLKAAKGAFGRLASKLGHGVVNKLVKCDKLKDKLNNKVCKYTGHPVDVASGMFYTDEEDFNLNGPIPLSWERKWYCESDYIGQLGNGWHHSYDMGIVIDPTQNNISLRMQDGRPLAFRTPRIDAPTFRKGERLEMRVNKAGEYYVWDINEDVYYYFTDKTFDGVQLLRSIVNANSFSIQFTYNEKGELTQIKDSAHRILNVKNDSKGRITQILTEHPDKKGDSIALATYIYDAKGNMIQQTNAVEDSMYFEYEGYLMVKETWRNGLNWFFEYDGTKIGSRCIHTWGDGDIYNHKLTFFNGLTKVENSLGHITEYYHRGGLVYKQVDPNGAEHQWLYDEDNQLISETDPMGNAYLYSYDDFGNQTEIIDPTGAKITSEFSNLKFPHLAVETIDANGGTWKWDYDDYGNVIEHTNPMGASSEMLYTDGLLTQVTNPKGNNTHLYYDSSYNITEVLDDQSNSSKYKYNTLSQCLKITNPKGAIQTRGFDAIGRVRQVNDFDGNTIELTYDGIDNLTCYKDSQQKVNYSYKGMWKLTRRTDSRGTTYYQYNTEEQLTKIINENGQAYTFTLDEVGNVHSEQGFDEMTKQFQRDKSGRVSQLIKASGKKVQYAYNNASQITEIIHSEEDIQTFQYNPAGQLLKAINNDAEVVFTRNKLGLITTEEINKQSITNIYDDTGRRIGLQSSLGAHINYQHDNFGNLANLSAGHEDTNWEAKYNYDSLGFELERLLPGKLEQQFNYDAIGRLTQQRTLQTKQQKHNRRYTWGINDRLHKTDDSKQGITKYSYTPSGHLEIADFQNGVQQIRSTDSVGNLYETKSNNDREYGNGGRLEKKGSWHYKYDADGFLIEKYKGSSSIFKSKKGHWQYIWNNAGMLQTVIRPDKEKVHFIYDALGRRLSKTFKSTTTKWLWDGNVPLHEWKEHAINGEPLSNSTVGDNGTITWVFEENSFIPTAKLKNKKTFSILADQLGTPTSMYNDYGEQIWTRTLDSFGKAITGDHSSCPFMYQGQYYDAEIELAYNRFRYFEPEDGRYISQDPIGLYSGEPNFYSYVDNPNLGVDIFGLANPYRKKDGKFANKPGPKKKKNDTHGNSVHSKKPRQHYVIIDEDGIPYHGVGDTKGNRAKASQKRLSEAHPDKTFIIESQTNHSNSMGAVKAEAQGIKNSGGAGELNPGNYNIINSPGAPYI